jgi:hypothetical protein
MIFTVSKPLIVYLGCLVDYVNSKNEFCTAADENDCDWRPSAPFTSTGGLTNINALTAIPAPGTHTNSSTGASATSSELIIAGHINFTNDLSLHPVGSNIASLQLASQPLSGQLSLASLPPINLPYGTNISTLMAAQTYLHCECAESGDESVYAGV